MAFAAMIYKVSVHPKGTPKDLRYLGNIDNAGKTLASIIVPALAAAGATPPATDKRHTSEFEQHISVSEPDFLAASFIGRRTGVRSVETLQSNGNVPKPKIETDSSSYRLSCAFWLPKGTTTGRAAFLVVDGHSCHAEATAAIRAAVPPDLILRMDPLVDYKAFENAVKKRQVKEIEFVKVRQGDEEFSTLGQDKFGKLRISTKVKPVGRDSRINWQHLFKWKSDGLDQLPPIEYDGVPYDEARVTVSLPNGERTYALTDTERGRALSEVIADWGSAAVDDFGYTADEMAAQLVAALKKHA